MSEILRVRDLDPMYDLEAAAAYIGTGLKELKKECAADLWRTWTTSGDPKASRYIRQTDLEAFMREGVRKPQYPYAYKGPMRLRLD